MMLLIPNEDSGEDAHDADGGNETETDVPSGAEPRAVRQ